MNELQQKKFTRLFSILDRDKNGAVERSDYESIGKQVAKLRGLSSGSPEETQIVSHMSTYWDALAKRADKDSNGQVTMAEWGQSMAGGSESMEQTRAQMVNLAASLMDRNGDGRITMGDYQELLEMAGYKLEDAQTIFNHLDRNKNGQIETSELATLVDEFLFSDDPNAPGNWLLGTL